MKVITIRKDEDIHLFTVLVDGEIILECLAADEVPDAIKDLIADEK